MTEDALQFGDAGALMGILSRPAPGAPPAAVACLLPNAGLIHRVGPHRLSVKLARALAGQGLPALRFDLAGVGDSRSGNATAGDYRAQASRDLQAAMDAVQAACGVQRFVVFGICSGAVNGFWAAVADPRVVGLLMYDGFWYRSRWTGLVRLAKRARSLGPGELWASVKRNMARLAGPKQAQPDGIFASWDMANPPRAEFVGHMNALAARGVALYLLYGGTVLEYYSYQRQFQHVFGAEPFARHTRCELHPQLDHTFTSLQAQQQVVALATEWAAGVDQAASSRHRPL